MNSGCDVIIFMIFPKIIIYVTTLKYKGEFLPPLCIALHVSPSEKHRAAQDQVGPARHRPGIQGGSHCPFRLQTPLLSVHRAFWEKGEILF